MLLVKSIRPTFLPHRLVLRTPRVLKSQLRYTSGMATVETITQEIAEANAFFNDARKQGADAAIIEGHKKKLGDLKRALGQLQGGSKDAGKKKERLLLKTAKVCPTHIPSIFPLKLTRFCTICVGHKRLWSCRDALP